MKKLDIRFDQEVELVHPRNQAGLLEGITYDYVLQQIQKYPLLMQHYESNKPQKQKLLIERFMRGPTPKDLPGFIYGYMLYNEYQPYANKYWIKMGRTIKQCNQRISEWEKEHGDLCLQNFAFRSETHKELESLVHLFFDYARQNRELKSTSKKEGLKNHIEWFSFKSKTLEPAVVNMIDTVMNTINLKSKGITYPDKVTVINNFNASPQFLEQIKIALFRVQNVKSRALLVGPERSGKSCLRNLMGGISVEFKKKGAATYELVEKKNGVPSQVVFETSFKKGENPSVDLLNSFQTWVSLCKCQSSVIVLVIKQADLECSQLLGLKKGLAVYQHLSKNLSNVNIVVTQASQDFTKGYYQELIEDNKSFIAADYEKLRKASVYTLPKAQKEGAYKPKVDGLFIHLEGTLKNAVGSDVFMTDERVKKQCHSIIDQFTHRLKQEYEQALSAKLKSLGKKSINKQVELFLKVKALINSITKKGSMRTTYQSMQKLNELLEAKQSLVATSMLMCFSECIANGGMESTMIFEDLLHHTLAEYESKALTNYKQEIETSLTEGKKILLEDLLTMSNDSKIVVKVITLLEKLKKTRELNLTIKDLSQIIQRISKQLPSCIVLLTLVQGVTEVLALGLDPFKLNIESKLASTAYEISSEYQQTKGKVQLQPQLQKKEQMMSVSEIHEVEKAFGQMTISKEFKESSLKNDNSSISKYKKHKPSESIPRCISDLLKQGETRKVFLDGNFDLDTKNIALTRSLLIMAKSVSFHENKISFMPPDSKFDLIIMARQFGEGYEKLNIGNHDKNVCMIFVSGNKYIALDSYYSKNPQELEVFKISELVKVFNKKIAQ